MMRIAVLAMSLASAAAFAPAANVRAPARVSPTMMAKDMSPSIPFLLAPKYYPAKDSLAIGDVGFDPLGLAEYFDIKWLREAEIKHGRVAMLAIVGLIVQEFWQIPGDLYNNPNPIAAANQVGPQVWGQIIFFMGVTEAGLNNGKMTLESMFEDKDRVPGDLGFDPLQLMEEGDPNEYKLKELTHCRLAMLGVSGMITQCGLTDSGLYGGHL